MTINNFDYTWDDQLNNGMCGWRITEHKDVRDADDFLTALKRKLS